MTRDNGVYKTKTGVTTGPANPTGLAGPAEPTECIGCPGDMAIISMILEDAYSKMDEFPERGIAKRGFYINQK